MENFSRIWINRGSWDFWKVKSCQIFSEGALYFVISCATLYPASSIFSGKYNKRFILLTREKEGENMVKHRGTLLAVLGCLVASGIVAGAALLSSRADASDNAQIL